MDDIVKQGDAGLASSADMAAAGAAANDAADASAFARYQQARPETTLTAQRNDLVRFVEYLAAVGVAADAAALFRTPTAWRGITHGLVAGFLEWQMQQGYAIASINRALATIKRYVKLSSGHNVTPEERDAILLVAGIAPRDARHIDARRATTRRSTKKARTTPVSTEQAAALKQHPDTPQGRRDTLLMCLLIDHGLRESEVHDLMVGDVDLKRGRLTFFRRKIGESQIHKLSADTLRAATAYLNHDALPAGGLLRSSRKGGALGDAPMSISAIKQRVRALGAAVGIGSLSPHDLRHYWATEAAERGVNPLRLQEAGGWTSLEMPRRYVERSKVANEGMV